MYYFALNRFNCSFISSNLPAYFWINFEFYNCERCFPRPGKSQELCSFSAVRCRTLVPKASNLTVGTGSPKNSKLVILVVFCPAGVCCHAIFYLDRCILCSVHQIDIIGAMVIVWRVRGKIIRSVVCNIVCNNCAQCNAHTWADLTGLWIGFCLTGLISLCLDSFLCMYVCVYVFSVWLYIACMCSIVTWWGGPGGI